MTNEQLAILLTHLAERLEDGMARLKAGLIDDLPSGKWDESIPTKDGLTFKTYEPLLQLEDVINHIHENIEALDTTTVSETRTYVS